MSSDAPKYISGHDRNTTNNNENWPRTKLQREPIVLLEHLAHGHLHNEENQLSTATANFQAEEKETSPGQLADLWLDQYSQYYCLNEPYEKDIDISDSPIRIGPLKSARRRLFSDDKASNNDLECIPGSDEENDIPVKTFENIDPPCMLADESSACEVNCNEDTVKRRHVDTRGYQKLDRQVQQELQQLVPIVQYPSYETDVQEVVAGSGNGRLSRRHFCTFCKKEFVKLPIHLERMHKDESLVQKLLSYPKGHEERIGLLAMVRLQGEKEFNRNRSINHGCLKVARRPKGGELQDAGNYTPCPDCGRLLQKRRLYRHHAKCFLKRSGSSYDRALQVHSKRFRDNIHNDANAILRQRIFPILRDDKYTRAIRFDRAAIVYGNIMALRYSTSTHHDNMIRSNLRLLGNLVLTAKKFNSAVTNIASLFRPLITDTVVEAILEIAGFKPLQGVYRAPSTAASLVALCKVTAEYWKSDCIKREDHTGVSRTDEFILVFKTEVSRYINKTVIENRTKLQRQKTIQIPDARDPELLTRYVKHGYERCSVVLKSADKFSFLTWKELGSYLIVALMLFNRRRPGEVERMELADYANIIEVDANQPEYSHLEPAEKQLADTYKLFAIRGKLNRNVQILMNPKMKKCLQLFLNYRKQAEVPDDNPYIFGLPSSDNLQHKYLKAAKCMEVFASKCNAARPDLLRPTVLRKHMATRIAALDLPENDVSDLAHHMGHAVDIHKGIYRQATLKRNVVKVTKMLKMVQGDPKADESSDEEINNVHSSPVQSSLDVIPSTPTSKAKQISLSGSSGKRKFNFPEPRDVKQRPRWTEAAKAALNMAFGEHINGGALPSGQQIQHAIRQYSPLRGRTVACIKAAVSNLLLRDRRLQQYRSQHNLKRKPRGRRNKRKYSSSSDSDDS